MDKKTINLKLTGNEEMLKKIMSLLSLVSYNSKIGHSGWWMVSCDGDGQDDLEFEPKELNDLKNTFGAYEVPDHKTTELLDVIHKQKVKEGYEKYL